MAIALRRKRKTSKKHGDINIQRDVSIPLVMNGTHVSGVGHEIKTMSVRQIHDDYLVKKRIKFQPPYQRDLDVWSDTKMRQFIGSIVNNMAVPPIYLCPATKGGVHYYPLDGLQRLMTIDRFLGNGFRLHALEGDKKIKLSWEQIYNDDSLIKTREAFWHKEIQLVIFDFMPLEDQRGVFVALNNGVPINADEETYCGNFLARRYLHIMWGDLFGNLVNIFGPRERANKRMCGLRSVHELLMLVAGGNIFGEPVHYAPEDDAYRAFATSKYSDDMTVESKGISKKERLKSAALLHRTIRDKELTYDDTDKAILKAIPIDYDLQSLREIINFFADFYRDRPNLGVESANEDRPSPRLARNILDPIAYFCMVINLSQINLSDLKNSKVKLHNVLKDYYSQKTSRNYKMQTVDPRMMSRKLSLLDEICKDKKFFG